MAGPETLHNALVAPVEELDLTSAITRGRFYEEAVLQAEAQTRAGLSDGPALFAMDRDGKLVAAALPSAKILLAGSNALVDLEASAEPWPTDARDGLAGRNEKLLAARAGSALVTALGLPQGAPVVIERAHGAPYAAAFVDGRIRLNPALLYLSSAAEIPAVPAFSRGTPLRIASPPPPGRMSCSASGSALLPWMALALAGAAFRRRA